MEFLKWCRHEWERAAAIAAVAGGFVAFVLGWLGQRDKALVVEQIPYVVSGALFGLLLIVIGTTMWLSADLHDEWIKLDRFEESVDRAVVALESAGSRVAEVDGPAPYLAAGPAESEADALVDPGPANSRGHRGGVSVAQAGE